MTLNVRRFLAETVLDEAQFGLLGGPISALQLAGVDPLAGREQAVEIISRPDPEVLTAVVPGGASMGFLSSIGRAIGGVARFVGRAVGIIPPAAAPVAAPARRIIPTIGRPARVLLPGAVGVAAGVGAGLALSPEQQAAVAARGGNGQFVTSTIVQTVDRMSGEVVNQRILQGSPFLMNRDLVVAKRVLRTAGKLGSRFGRRTREPSKSKQLLDAIQDRALRQVITAAAPCPA